MNPADTPDTAELAIRLARATFNRALAHHDLDAIARLLAPQAVLVAGTDSALLSGRKAQLIAWKREFAAPPATATLYTRTPATILPSPSFPIALEQGHWQGTNPASGQLLASGSYSAKWRRFGTDWRIEAEIYLTMV